MIKLELYKTLWAQIPSLSLLRWWNSKSHLLSVSAPVCRIDTKIFFMIILHETRPIRHKILLKLAGIKQLTIQFLFLLCSCNLIWWNCFIINLRWIQLLLIFSVSRNPDCHSNTSFVIILPFTKWLFIVEQLVNLCSVHFYCYHLSLFWC